MKPLTFDSYSEVRMTMGYCLFFPRLVEEQRNPHKPRSRDIQRVMIVAADPNDRRVMTGVALGQVLHVDLESKAFFELLHALEERNLKSEPLRFDFELDDDGALRRLQIDDTWTERS